MAGAVTYQPLSYQANEALTKNRFVKLAGNELVDAIDTAGERALGLNQTSVSATEATDGKTVAVHVEGVVWVEASGACTRGSQLACSDNGRVTDGTTGDIPVGICLSAPSTVDAGDLVLVLLTPGLPALL